MTAGHWFPGMRDKRQQGAGGKNYNGYEETLEGHGYMHYFDCGDGFTYKLIKLYILNI